MYDEHTDERQGAYFNYKKYHLFHLFMNSPDIVVVDTEIIANAPVSSSFLLLSI